MYFVNSSEGPVEISNSGATVTKTHRHADGVCMVAQMLGAAAAQPLALRSFDSSGPHPR